MIEHPEEIKEETATPSKAMDPRGCADGETGMRDAGRRGGHSVKGRGRPELRTEEQARDDDCW